MCLLYYSPVKVFYQISWSMSSSSLREYLKTKDRFWVDPSVKGSSEEEGRGGDAAHWLRWCSPWGPSLSALSSWVMAAGSLDNELVGLDWTCYSITFNNIYTQRGGRQILGVLCLCRDVGLYSRWTDRKGGRTGHAHQLCTYTVSLGTWVFNWLSPEFVNKLKSPTSWRTGKSMYTLFCVLFVCSLVGLHGNAKNTSTDSHVTWWKDVGGVREEDIIFWCGSRSGGRSRNCL